MMNVESVLIFVGIFFVAFVCGVIPYVLKRINLPRGIFESITALSGGILLGAALFHIFPEGVSSFSGMEAHSHGTHDHTSFLGFPRAFLYVALIALVVLVGLVLIEGASNTIFIKTTSGSVESKTSSYLLLASLSVHSVFAGMALGLEAGAGGSAFSAILFSILSHKGVAAFALGAAFVKKSIKTNLGVLFIVLFSTMTPFGFLFGSFIEEIFSGSLGKTTNGLFISIAVGTFIYISVVDFLKNYINESNKISFRYVTLFNVGIVVMAFLNPHQH